MRRWQLDSNTEKFPSLSLGQGRKEFIFVEKDSITSNAVCNIYARKAVNYRLQFISQGNLASKLITKQYLVTVVILYHTSGIFFGNLNHADYFIISFIFFRNSPRISSLSREKISSILLLHSPNAFSTLCFFSQSNSARYKKKFWYHINSNTALRFNRTTSS